MGQTTETIMGGKNKREKIATTHAFFKAFPVFVCCVSVCSRVYRFVVVCVLAQGYLISPFLAYNFSELIESHAVDTYTEFAEVNKELLQSLPPTPQVRERGQEETNRMGTRTRLTPARLTTLPTVVTQGVGTKSRFWGCLRMIAFKQQFDGRFS